jgi:uncharacterized protein (TIGR03790 family)
LVVYNSSVPDSVAVANHYASVRGIPAANLCPIVPANTSSVTRSQYVLTVKTPVQNCLTNVGPTNILYIVFTYQTPYDIQNPSTGGYSLDQYVADIWDQYSNQDFYPFPLQFQPYYEDAQSQGNVYQTFLSFAVYRAQNSTPLIYSVWRLDAPSAALAEGLVDKALAAEQSGLAGQACLDRQQGAISGIYDSDYGEGEWDLHQAATFAGQAGFTVTEDSNIQEFGTPPAPNCPNAALYSGWYRLNHYNDAFTWNTGAIGWHLDSASALNPRSGPNWSANAILRGITATTGAMAEPYLQGMVRPGGAFRDLLQGANVGDAFLRNTRWLKWMILNMGDPLYRPFPNGIAPFNPPPPQASLGLSPRYILNGASATGTITLATAAPPGGTLVNLNSSNTALISVPASVTVPAGSRTASFTATAVGTPLATQDTPAAITASGVGKNSLTVMPLLGGTWINPSVIIGGAPSGGLLVLNGNAPAGGTVVSLSSNNPATVPPTTVTVPQGASQAAFTINSNAVSASTTTQVTATLNGASNHASLTLRPALTSMSMSTASAPGGANAIVILVSGAPAPAGGWQVNLSSSNPSVASVPSVVTFAAGTTYLQVPVTSTPQCTSASVTFTATSGVTTLTTGFTVTPPPPSLVYFTTPIVGGHSESGTVTLAFPACSTGLPVALASDNSAVASVPPTVTVAAGQKNATFTITTTYVVSSTTVNISATSDNVTKSKALTVNP